MIDRTKLYRCPIAPGIIELYSNVKVIQGFFPVNLQRGLNPEPTSTPATRMTFLVRDLPRWQSYSSRGFGSTYGEPCGDSLYRQHNIFGPLKAKIELSGLCHHPSIIVNKPYYGYGKIRIGDFYPPGVHLRDVLSVMLNRSGYQPLFSSAFANAGDGILVIGSPDIGKTLVTLQAIRHGFQYLSDDLTIADSSGRLHACPGISSFASELKRIPEFHPFWDRGVRITRLLNLLSRIAPMAGILFKQPYLDVKSLAEQAEFVNEANARYIFILAEGNGRTERLSDSRALSMLMAINRYVLSYSTNPMILTYSLLNPWLDITELMHAEERLLQKLVAVSNCYLCVAPNPREYFGQIQKLL